VRECDFYLAVVGLRYGSLVPDRADGLSYTELEFLTATRLGIPRLVFLLDERAEVPSSLVDPDHTVTEPYAWDTTTHTCRCAHASPAPPRNRLAPHRRLPARYRWSRHLPAHLPTVNSICPALPLCGITTQVPGGSRIELGRAILSAIRPFPLTIDPRNPCYRRTCRKQSPRSRR